MSCSGLCPSCKTGILEEETEIADVCKHCGYTVENVSLRQQSAIDGYSGSAPISLEYKYKTHLQESTTTRLQKEILENMRSYLGRYPNNDLLYERASQIFLSTFHKKKMARCAYKSSIGVACMAMVLRDAGISVLLPTICRENGVDSNKMMRAMNEIKQVTLRDETIVTIEGVVDNILQNNPATKNRHDLRVSTMKICHLLMDLKFSGPREVVVTIALYFAVITEEPVKVPPLRFSVFCKQYSIRHNEALGKQYNSMKAKIVVLAQRLPWSPSDVKSRNYHTFLKDILKLQHVLIKEDWNDSDKISVRKRKADFASDGSVITDQMKLEMPVARIQALRKVPRLSDETPDPPFVSMSETLDDSGMDEEELDEYIRSPEEVEVLARLQKKLGMRK